ncbi:hypothetical protein [Phytobacter ursingii]|uniref:Uncharacterized protein n=1 Tax=Phytobacter ursingii TaxID=1972431 RepID=A0AB35RRZ6_9ENTR|nr:hypothetical protein [Phytobacter ursingii]MDV2864366.1 hypothetical protein [Phytobacter ursingii]
MTATVISAETIISPFPRMSAQAPRPGYDLVAPVSAAPPGNLPRMSAQAPRPGYDLVAPVSAAPPGNLPDVGASASSGLRSGSPGKRSATGESPGWRRKRLVRATIW